MTLAGHSDAAAIVAVTRGGKTARVLSALRPHAPIYAATSTAEIGRQLALTWGVVPLVCDLGTDVPHAITSPGISVMSCEIMLTCSAGVKIMSEIG